MAEFKKFKISGEVIDPKTNKGVGRLRVEAWDLDKKYHDLLGVDTTSGEGQFQITFDESYFREFAPGKAPDLFFKVYRGNRLIKSTEDSVIWDAKTKTKLSIEIDTQSVIRPGKDRVSALQVMNGARFVQGSDFRGLLQETDDKRSQFTGYVADIVKNTFVNLEAKPVKAPTLRTRDVVDQDVAIATERFQAQNITVNEVSTYRPGLNARTISDLEGFAVRLVPGSKVNLYEKDGKVKYYSVVKAPKVAGLSKDVESDVSELEERKASLADNAAIRIELDGLTSEKAVMTQELANLRQEITTMNQERAAMQDTGALREQLAELSSMHRELSLSIAKDRPVKSVTGVGKTMDAQLREIGIRTVGELAAAKVGKLVSGGISDVHATKVITAAKGSIRFD